MKKVMCLSDGMGGLLYSAKDNHEEAPDALSSPTDQARGFQHPFSLLVSTFNVSPCLSQTGLSSRLKRKNKNQETRSDEQSTTSIHRSCRLQVRKHRDDRLTVELVTPITRT